MRVALIPPKGLEPNMWRTDMQMVLAPRLVGDTRHLELVKNLAAMSKNHVIMDNGACEGNMVDASMLSDLTKLVGVSEVVLPDHLKNREDTEALVKLYLTSHRAQGVHYMAVAQGATADAMKRCIDTYAMEPAITVLGLPRLMITRENVTARLDLAMWVSETYGNRFAIHFLGVSKFWPREIHAAGKYYSNIVRSIDTSAPYNYAIKGEALDTSKVCIGRIGSYFTKNWAEEIDQALVKHNEEVVRSWAIGIR